MEFGWVLGRSNAVTPVQEPDIPQVVANHATVEGDDLLQKFWEVEELTLTKPVLSTEKRLCYNIFKTIITVLQKDEKT